MPGDIATVCGVTYVMEGSRMGGGLLARRVGPDLPAAYLGAPAQIALWRAFLDSLDTHLTSAHDIARAGEAANRIFDLFRTAGEQRLAA